MIEAHKVVKPRIPQKQMDLQSQKLLEFDSIRSWVARELRSAQGHKLFETWGFYTSLKGLMEFREALEAVLLRHAYGNSSPRGELADPEPLLRDLELRGSDAVLDGAELVAIASWIEQMHELYNWMRGKDAEHEEELSPVLETYVGAVVPTRAQKAIREILVPDGNIKPGYPPLEAMRAQMRQILAEQQRVGSDAMKIDGERFQEAHPHFYGNRMVLPVKRSHVSQVEGIIHGSSNSGATVFIESTALARINNRLAAAEEELNAEMRAIYRKLTAEVRKEQEAMREVLAELGEIDMLLALARVSIAMGGHIPDVADEVDLIDARHPLLGDEAVPVSMHFDKTQRGIVLSGPNAGGKSVTMKTLGLFALMNQYGLIPPVGPESSLPLYKDILAVVGDNQDIFEGLSTFSGKMKRLSEVFARIAPGALVLLDEFADGTDPKEGVPLAQAVLEYSLDKGAQVLITSHHQGLKRYGRLDKRVLSVAMEFSEGHPTFSLLPGRIGESHGIETAANCGIPSAIIDRAWEYYRGEETSLEARLSRLEEDEKALAEARAALAEAEAELEERRAKMKETEARLIAREAKATKAQASEGWEFLSNARKEYERLIREIKEGKRSEDDSRARQLFSEVEATTKRREHKSNNQQAAARAKKPKSQELTVGARVEAGPFGRDGIIERIDGNRIMVAMGSIRMQFAPEDIKLKEGGDQQKLSVSYEGSDGRSSSAQGGNAGSGKSRVRSQVSVMSPDVVLKIIGMRAEEAQRAVEAQLDRAVSNGLKSFSIIHGMGSGVLQQVVRDCLLAHPMVETFEYARPELGGTGRTEVEMK